MTGALAATSVFAALGFTSQPDPDDVSERLKRIETGLFRKDSRLPTSELESIEQLIRKIPKLEVGTSTDHSRQLDDIERQLRDIERAIGEIDRDIGRVDPLDVQRELDALERQLTETEREADDARRRADSAERDLTRLERRVSALERKR
jgi:uncharacterized coiled-coil DUF342 family protein